jgi:hypothetical protein
MHSLIRWHTLLHGSFGTLKIVLPCSFSREELLGQKRKKRQHRVVEKKEPVRSVESLRKHVQQIIFYEPSPSMKIRGSGCKTDHGGKVLLLGH